MTPGVRIGIDLGGTKTEIAVLDGDGRELLRRRAATPSGDYDATLRLIVQLVGDAERELGPTASVGVGTPGAISPATGRIRNSNSTCLNGRPLREDIERALGRRIAMANDANCFVLSEASDGAAAGAAIAFGVILGTGVGGGVCVHGRVLEGANAIAGEWGHNPLPWPHDDERPGSPCYCGRLGCIETWLSGPALARDHAARSGERIAADAIVSRSISGSAAARETLERYMDRLARALASVINILDPDVIVLGGGLSNIDALYDTV
ncbi:MAG TPA: ROK family protein, partial [Burkholderiales bacterium]|nr:ROK family protein [Burkholderiales bacterium]